MSDQEMFQEFDSKHNKNNHQTVLFPSSPKNYFKKYKEIIIITTIVIIAITLIFTLLAPIIPVQVIKTEIRTRNLQFNSEVHDALFGNDLYYPSYVSVTNLDSEGGTFLVTMNKTLVGLNQYWQPYTTVENTTTESMYIAPATTDNFNVPESWGYLNITSSSRELTYSVSAPTIQENYSVVIIEHKSIIDLFR